MEDIQFKWDAEGKGAFVIELEGKRVAEMIFDETGEMLTVHHTEVSPQLEGQGIAKKLLAKLVGYARENHKKIIPLCPFVVIQFKKNTEEYKDLWQQ